MTFKKVIQGSNEARVIQLIRLKVTIRVDSDKNKNPDKKLDEIEKELEQVIEKYFDSVDWCPGEKWERY